MTSLLHKISNLQTVSLSYFKLRYCSFSITGNMVNSNRQSERQSERQETLKRLHYEAMSSSKTYL